MRTDHELVVALIGQPNVGKSVVMNRLTGAGAIVSNYPGTTVEITESKLQSQGRSIRVLDTPGIYSLHSDTEEQRVTHRVLLEENIDLIVNVVDASHLATNLYLTLQLLDFEIPMVIALNQMDMTKELGIAVSEDQISSLTGVTVIPMVATKGEGVDSLRRFVEDFGNAPSSLGRQMTFTPQVESVIEQLREHLAAAIPQNVREPLSHPLRALAIHLLEHDRLDESLLKAYPEIFEAIEVLQKDLASGRFVCKECFRGCAFCPRNEGHPPLVTCLERTQQARELAAKSTYQSGSAPTSIRARIQSLLDRPLPGIPLLILTAVISLAVIQWFMGVSESVVNSILEPILARLAPLSSSLAHSRILSSVTSAIPDGLLMPLSVVLPAMVSIYAIMAVLEDTGLLPRIAVAVDRLLSPFGMPGQAIIPLILGFGCKVPAVLGTRSVPGKRARLVLSVLLAVTIPCAATVGAVTGLAVKFGANLTVIYCSIAAAFLVIGIAISRLVPPSERDIALELPPFRAPELNNVLLKLWMRLQGFFTHVLPILVLTSIGVRVAIELGLFSSLARIGSLSGRWLGISGEALAAVAVSAVQRYMGPIVLLNLPLTAREATIAGAMVCISLPCLPVTVLIVKENGWLSLAVVYAVALTACLLLGLTLNVFLPVF